MFRSFSFVLAAATLLAAMPIRAVELAPGIELIPGGFVPGAQPDGNTLVLRGPDGLVVVDSGRHAEHTRKIVDFARAAGLPVRAIVNTHWHLDHVAGNPVLRREFPGLQVLSSAAIEEAKSGFLAGYRKQLEELTAQAESPEAAAPFRIDLAILRDVDALSPDEVIAASGRRSLAGRELDFHFEPHAVTGGDLWLVDPATKTAIAGDLVTLPVPFLDTACPARWQAALGRVAAAEWTTLVPGHGEPMDRAAFATYRTAFDNLLSCAASTAAKEACVDGWLRDAEAFLPESERERTRGMADYYVEQVLRGPAERLAKLCAE
jgi:glyoxylase-like metal-dependent hydrolase (beta-lactamase superfamily II)